MYEKFEEKQEAYFFPLLRHNSVAGLKKIEKVKL